MTCPVIWYQGENSVATPNVDRLAREGIVFPVPTPLPPSAPRSGPLSSPGCIKRASMHTIIAVPGGNLKSNYPRECARFLNFSTKRDILQPTVMQLSRDAAKKITTLIMKVQTCMTGSTGVNANRTSHSLPKFNYAAVNTAILRKPIRRSVRNCLPPLIQNP